MVQTPEIYVFQTKLAARQVAEALRSTMDESELAFLFRVRAEGHLPIMGNVEGNKFRLMRRPGYLSTDYAGIFDGNIFEERDCTRLEGQFVKVRFGFPFGSRNSKASSTSGIKVGIAILIAFETYNLIASFTGTDHPLINPPSVFACLFLVILCVWYPLAIGIQRRQREFILHHLKTVLNVYDNE